MHVKSRIWETVTIVVIVAAVLVAWAWLVAPKLLGLDGSAWSWAAYTPMALAILGGLVLLLWRSLRWVAAGVLLGVVVAAILDELLIFLIAIPETY